MARAQPPAAPDLMATAAPSDGVWLETLDLSRMTQDYGTAHASRSVDSNPLAIGGVSYSHGIGTHAMSEFDVDLKGVATRFLADVGIDDEKKASRGSVAFEVWVDGVRKAQTGVMRGGQPAQHLSVDLTGAKLLRLIVTDGDDGIDSDHGDWGGALVLMAPGATAKLTAITTVPLASEPSMPIAMGPDSPKPAIHGARVVGGTPGRPFLYRIAATGAGPLRFAATNLPVGLTLNAQTGVISGAITRPGQFVATIRVTGPKGAAQRNLVIVGGQHKLALTPPMGWNSWNVWGTSVTADKVRAAANAFETDGLAAHGFTYINIDDAWEGKRADDGAIQTNAKFGDMKSLADYVHAKGLRLGIYSSPGPTTCGGYTGSYQHEVQDAATYASWGIDYLKYDWCSYGNIAGSDHSIAALEKPYMVMRDALDKADRDIVYSLCQYGMGNSWTWASNPPILGNCWRTTGDINDSWSSLAGIGFRQNGHEVDAGPGHWNDPDMLVVGKLGWGDHPHPTKLTGNEQITHLSLWCLLSSPLLIGCDLTQIDPFTHALLTNDEMLDVNQDPLGRPAGRVATVGETEVWSRPLFDGTIAVGLFNRGRAAASVTAQWSDLGLRGKQPIRDLWQRKDLKVPPTGRSPRPFPPTVRSVLKIGKPSAHRFTVP